MPLQRTLSMTVCPFLMGQVPHYDALVPKAKGHCLQGYPDCPLYISITPMLIPNKAEWSALRSSLPHRDADKTVSELGSNGVAMEVTQPE